MVQESHSHVGISLLNIILKNNSKEQNHQKEKLPVGEYSIWKSTDNNSQNTKQGK